MKVAVLMSGGVDSSVAAMLLKDKGYQVAGLTMINWDEGVADKAAETAHYLGIKHYVVDFRGAFEKKVIQYFYRTYENACTPNPCVECNKYIKFGVLLNYAIKLGFDAVATGHYARVEYNPEIKRWLLRKGVDETKDQSYFLYGLKQQQLSRCLFPLGKLIKAEVVSVAKTAGIKAAREKESQEICFVKGDYRDFIRNKVKFKAGEVVNKQGELLGQHQGLPFYTIGQRKGLGISAGRPVYVVDVNREENRLVLDNEAFLFHNALIAVENNFIAMSEINREVQVQAKIRYASKPADAVIVPIGNEKIKVRFVKEQRAITPGQSVVYYTGDYVLGGGIIKSPI